jgi:SAM-dependent methyltransferase
VLRRELDQRAGPLTIVDVGGGTGGFAVPLAQAGHRVTVIDASPDALAALLRRAAESGVRDLVTATQGDAESIADLVEPESADLVLCHSLLEVVEEPATVVKSLAAALRPGGAASVVVANRAAAVLSRALTGHLAGALALLADPHGGDQPGGRPRDTLRRRFDAASAGHLLESAGLVVEEIHGVRVVADLVAPADAHPAALVELELAVAGLAPYRDIATALHLLARRC